MRKSALLFAICLLLAGQSAYAAPIKWGQDTMAQISKGELQEDIAALLGNPVSQKTGLGGTEIWVYRKAAGGHQLTNAWIGLVSFGMASSGYVDVLTVTFVGGKVVDASYEANVSNDSSLSR